MTQPSLGDPKPPRPPRALTILWWVAGLAVVAWAFARGGGEGASPTSAAVLRASDFDACVEKTPAQLRKWLGPPASIDSVSAAIVGGPGGPTSRWTWQRWVRETAADQPAFRTITVGVTASPDGEASTVSCVVR